MYGLYVFHEAKHEESINNFIKLISFFQNDTFISYFFVGVSSLAFLVFLFVFFPLSGDNVLFSSRLIWEAFGSTRSFSVKVGGGRNPGSIEFTAKLS